jgi:hypothetical protein
MPRTLERLLTWLCLVFVAGVSMLLTYPVLVALVEGEIQRYSSKYRSSTVVVVTLSQDPGGYFSSLFAHALLAAAAWAALVVAWRRTSSQR